MNRKRVMLIVPPHAGRAVWEFPLGVGYLANQLEEVGFHVSILDINGLQLDQHQVAERLRIASSDYKLYGISAFSTQFGYAVWLIDLLKQIDQKNFVALGGPLSTHHPELCLKYTRADIACAGEADQTIGSVFANPWESWNIRGVVWRNGEEIVVNEPPEPFDLDELKFHPYHLFPEEVYFKRLGKGVNIATTRGCPFQCNFCSKTVTQPRKRSIQHIEAELIHLKKNYGLRGVQLSDELAVTNSERGYELCEMLARLKLNWGCQVRVDLVDRALLKHMKACGCNSLGAGVESGSQRILDAMNKKTTVEQNLTFMLNCQAVGILPWVQFIFGYPGEDEQSIRQSIALFKQANYSPPRPDFTGKYIMSSVATPLPGSRLYDDLVRRGLIDNELNYLKRIERGYYIIKPEDVIYNLTGWDDKEMMARKRSMETEIWQNWRQRANNPLRRIGRAIRAFPRGISRVRETVRWQPDRPVVPEEIF